LPPIDPKPGGLEGARQNGAVYPEKLKALIRQAILIWQATNIVVLKKDKRVVAVWLAAVNLVLGDSK